MQAYEAELRLALAVALNAWVIFCTFRFTRTFTAGDWIARSRDALLLWFAIQYASIGICGLVGLIGIWTVGAMAVVVSGALLLAARGSLEEREPDAGSCPSHRVSAGSLFVVIGFLTALAYEQRLLPVLSNDGLIYHLPAAVRWMQTGRIGLFDAWFVNPANTYSPLAGSVLMCWWMLPMGDDSLVRFVQAPFALLLFFAVTDLCRSAGVKPSLSSLIAGALVLSRPFVSQAAIVKDDLMLAAFFAAAVSACSTPALRDRAGSLRLGLAVGLFVATKYTALHAVPLLFLLVDAPVRAGWSWKRWVFAIAVCLAVCLPWFVRNAMQTGNPLFPVPVGLLGWKGLYVAERATDMRTLAGVWRALTGMYHSPGTWLALTLACCWLGALFQAGRALLREPLCRAIVLGAPAGLVIFAFLSHAAEIRYAFPSLVLLFACVGIALKRLPASAQLAAGGALALACMLTGFTSLREVPEVPIIAMVAGGVAGFIFAVQQPRRDPILKWGGIGAIFLLALVVFVYWKSYLTACRDSRELARATQYGADQSALWEFVETLPAGSKLAYTGTSLVHPLLGERYQHLVFCEPAREYVRHYHDLPPATVRLTDQQLRGYFTDLLQQEVSRESWRERIETSGAQYLLIARSADLPEPVERAFAETDPRFVRKFGNDAGAIYELRLR